MRWVGGAGMRPGQVVALPLTPPAHHLRPLPFVCSQGLALLDSSRASEGLACAACRSCSQVSLSVLLSVLAPHLQVQLPSPLLYYCPVA